MLLASVPVMASDTTTISPKSYGIDNLNNEKGDLIIAFLGGSITAGSGCSWTNMKYPDCDYSGYPRWSTQITKRYFQAKYPNKNVKEVNAAIGGTRSDFGLFRMKTHLLDKCGSEGPDVVFVEFAVNDKYESNTDPVRVQQRMEGIVRQLAALPKQPVIIFVFTAAKDSEQSDFTPYLTSAQVHKKVADYYGIGSINLCEYVAGGIDMNGNPIVWSKLDKNADKTWSGDLVHPNDTGYTGYADFIKKQFVEHPEQYFKKLTWKKIPMSNYEFGAPTMHSHKSGRFATSGTWNVDTSSKFSSNFPDGVFTSSQPGATLSFDFKGRSLGIYYSAGKGGGKATYTITEKESKTVVKTDVINCAGGSDTWANNYVVNPLTTLEPKEYTVKVVVSAPSGSTPEMVAIAYFMVDEEQPDPIVYDVKTDCTESSVAGKRIKGSYCYLNAEKEEGDTTLQWMVSNTKNGTYQKISNAKKANFTPDDSYIGKYVKFTVIPEDILGTAGKSISSEPVLISRPASSEAFQISNIQFLKNSKPVSSLVSGQITSKASVTNKLKVSQKVMMITAEYLETASGAKSLISTKRETVEIGAGETKDLAAELTVVGGENHIVQTMIVASDNLEPLCNVAKLLSNAVVYVGVENEDGPMYTYQINQLGSN